MSSAHGGYYLPDPTKWPTITSMGLFLLALGFILDLHHLAPGLWLMIAGSVIIILMLYSWFGQVAGESEGWALRCAGGYVVPDGNGLVYFLRGDVFRRIFRRTLYTRILSVPWLASEELLWPGFEATWPSAGYAGATYIGPDNYDIGSNQFSSIGALGIPLPIPSSCWYLV